MPKRSLSAKDLQEVERLNQAVEEMLAHSAGKTPQSDPNLSPLLRVASALRELPRESFKASLKENLERSTVMATTTEPIAAVRTSASPRLSYRSPEQAIEFYERAFGAKESWRFETDSGIAHAEIKIGDSVVLVCGEWPEGGRLSAETLGQSPVSMVLNVPDVDAFIAHAVATGAKVVRPVADQFYGHREGTVSDPYGYQWTASMVKEEMPVEEMHRRFRTMMASQPKPAVNPVPPGYRTVTPYIVAEDAAGLIDFVERVFDAEKIFQSVGGTGGIHSEIRLGDSMLMIGGGGPGLAWRGVASPGAFHVYVPDCDAVYERALIAGATSIAQPADQPYGERSGSVRDAARNHWYIATRPGTGKGKDKDDKDKDYKWEGAPDVQPYLHPLRAEPVVNFLQRAFGARDLGRYASPDGVVHHMTLKIGESYLELGEAQGPYQPMASMFYLYVPDCDAVYRNALAAGAVSISEPKDQPYGDRSGGVKDVFGNIWHIATHIKDVTP